MSSRPMGDLWDDVDACVRETFIHVTYAGLLGAMAADLVAMGLCRTTRCILVLRDGRRAVGEVGCYDPNDSNEAGDRRLALDLARTHALVLLERGAKPGASANPDPFPWDPP